MTSGMAVSVRFRFKIWQQPCREDAFTGTATEKRAYAE